MNGTSVTWMKQAVAAADLGGHLADGLQEGLGFDIAGRAADLGDDHVGLGLFADRVDERLDLVGDMRDDLHGFAQVFAPRAPCCSTFQYTLPVVRLENWFRSSSMKRS